MIIENETYSHHSNSNDDENWNRWKYIIIRSSVVVVLLTGIILNTIYAFVLPHSNIDCVLDNTFIWTSSVNSFFKTESTGKFVLLIVSSLLVDIIFIFSAYTWIAYGRSWRLYMALFLYYTLDILMQFIFQIKIPDGYILEYPGFPSFVVSYMKTTSMFYSGPVGFLVIVTMEFWKIGNYYMFAFTMATLLLQILTRNFMRANYIIDIFSAIVVGHYLFILADDICPKYFDNIDNEWFRLTISGLKDMDYSDLLNNDENEDKYHIDIEKDKKKISYQTSEY